jgi:hypothetical protein
MGFITRRLQALIPLDPVRARSVRLHRIFSPPFSTLGPNFLRHSPHCAGRIATNPPQVFLLNRPYHRHAWRPDFAPEPDSFSGRHFSKFPFRKENYEIIDYRHRSGLRRSGWFCSSRRDIVPEMLQGQGLRHLLQRQVLRVQTVQ